jgi:hypothetical protein
MLETVVYAGLVAPWLAALYIMVADEIDYRRSRRHG